MKLKLNARKVKSALRKFNDLEFRYLRLQISFANDARTLIKDFKLSKEEFCKLMDIYEFEYDDYIRGSYEYSVMSMAKIQAAFMKLSGQRDLEARKKQCEEEFTDIVKKAKEIMDKHKAVVDKTASKSLEEFLIFGETRINMTELMCECVTKPTKK